MNLFLFFKDSFIANLLRIIQRMNPAMRQKQAKTETKGPLTGGELKTNDPSVKKILCPALALPDQKLERENEEPAPEYVLKLDSSRDKKKKNASRSASRSPNQRKKKQRSRTRSRSRDRRRSRSRSRDKRRSRSRDRRDRRREDSRDRKNSSRHDKYERNRSRDEHAHPPKSDEPVVGEVCLFYIILYLNPEFPI